MLCLPEATTDSACRDHSGIPTPTSDNLESLMGHDVNDEHTTGEKRSRVLDLRNIAEGAEVDVLINPGDRASSPQYKTGHVKRRHRDGTFRVDFFDGTEGAPFPSQFCSFIVPGSSRWAAQGAT